MKLDQELEGDQQEYYYARFNSSSEQNFQTQQNRARALGAPREKKVRVVAVDELRSEAEDCIVEDVENVD